MERPLVSIITPCYNGERYLNRYFQSILNQTYSHLELIFINDGSMDKTEEIALSYQSKFEQKGIRFIYLYQDNEGQASALNKGLKVFSGDFLTWPDSDDVMSVECIEKKVNFMVNNNCKICLCTTAIVNENQPDKIVGYFKRIISENEYDDFFEDIIFLNNVYFAPGGYMVSADAFLDVIPDRNIFQGRGGQNAQILLPILYKYHCKYMSDVLYTYYIREDSHSHTIYNAHDEITQIELYVTIILETLKKIGINVFEKYENRVKSHYAHICYGNSLGTDDMQLISNYYNMLKNLKCITILERMRYFKRVICNLIKSFAR